MKTSESEYKPRQSCNFVYDGLCHEWEGSYTVTWHYYGKELDWREITIEDTDSLVRIMPDDDYENVDMTPEMEEYLCEMINEKDQ